MEAFGQQFLPGREDVIGSHGEMLNAGAKGLGDETASQGAPALGAVQSQAKALVQSLDDLAADDVIAGPGTRGYPLAITWLLDEIRKYADNG